MSVKSTWPGQSLPYGTTIVLVAIALLILGAQTLLAQQTTAAKEIRISGTVVDIDHAVVPGAEITFASSRGTVTSLFSDQDGRFSFVGPDGSYEVRVKAVGFEEISKRLPASIKDEALELMLPVAGSIATVTITDSLGYGVGTISTATKTDTALRDIPQSISVVTDTQIREQSMASIGEVVNYIPGITSHQGENNRDQLVIRGNSTSADFFLNGVRDDVQYYRDLYNVERVEALKGPNSMTFGRGGGGGVVNRVSKQAGFTPLREVTAQGGSFGNKRFTTDIDQPFGNKFAARLTGMFEDSNSFRNHVELQRYGLNPTVTITPGDKTAITLSYENFHDRRVADRGMPSYQGFPIDSPIETYFGDPHNSRVRAAVNLLSANIEHQAGRFLIRNHTMFGDYDRFYQNYVPGAVSADKSRVALSAYNNATDRRNTFNQTDVAFTVETGGIKHNFLTGTEFGTQHTQNFRNTGFFNNTATSIQIALSDPTISTPITFRQSATDADNRVKTNLGAAYVQDQVQLSRKFQVIAGGRFDYFDLQFHNNRNGQDLRRIDRLFAPRAGVVFKPVDTVSIYGNYSVAYLPGSGDQFSSLTVITQQVKPEKFSNYEVGAKWDLARKLSFTTALYRQDRTNTRATDPNDPTRILQTGSQRTNGYELSAAGQLTSKWTINGGYAYQDAYISSATTAAPAGARVAMVPKHNFSLWNNYRLIPRLAVGFGVIRHSDMFAAIDNTVVLPGYTTANAAVFFSINESWRLQANFQNVFDTRYFLNADGNNNITPGAPRSARVSVIARF